MESSHRLSIENVLHVSCFEAVKYELSNTDINRLYGRTILYELLIYEISLVFMNLARLIHCFITNATLVLKKNLVS